MDRLYRYIGIVILLTQPSRFCFALCLIGPPGQTDDPGTFCSRCLISQTELRVVWYGRDFTSTRSLATLLLFWRPGAMNGETISTDLPSFHPRPPPVSLHQSHFRSKRTYSGPGLSGEMGSVAGRRKRFHASSDKHCVLVQTLSS